MVEGREPNRRWLHFSASTFKGLLWPPRGGLLSAGGGLFEDSDVGTELGPPSPVVDVTAPIAKDGIGRR